MKQLLFLLLFPCLAMAQYQGNGNQKITLGEQTTADGLIWRGVAADTTLTVKSDTAAYFVLDTVNLNLFTYKTSASGAKWRQLGADTAVIAYVNTYGTQTVNGAKTFTSVVTGARFNPTANTVTGTGMYLPSANNLGLSTNSNNRVLIDNFGNFMYGGRTIIEPSQGLASDGTIATFQISKNDNATNNNDKIADIRLVNANSFALGGIGRIVAVNPLNPTGEKRVAQISFFQDSLNTGSFAFNVLNLGTLQRVMLLKSNGNVAIARPSDFIATAKLHIGQGTATAGTAPLKFTSGTNLTTAEAGAMEFNGTNLFFSPSTTRHTVNHGLTGSATLDFPNTSANTYSDLTISITGAALSDVVSLGIPNASMSANNITYTAWVSAANTVTVRFANHTTGSIDPASGTFKVFVTK